VSPLVLTVVVTPVIATIVVVVAAAVLCIRMRIDPPVARYACLPDGAGAAVAALIDRAGTGTRTTHGTAAIATVPVTVSIIDTASRRAVSPLLLTDPLLPRTLGTLPIGQVPVVVLPIIPIEAAVIAVSIRIPATLTTR
jgi:hypothetical protein